MPGREGLNFDEKAVDSARASFQSYLSDSRGIQMEHLTSGELVLTQKGIVFIEFKGTFSVKQIRHHSYEFDSIKAVRTESRGITGSLTGEEFLVVDIEDWSSLQGLDPLNYRLYGGNALALKYSCNKNDCSRIKKTIDSKLSFKSAIEQFEKELIRQIKPVAEVDLKDVAKTQAIRSCMEKMLSKSELNDDITMNAVIERVRTLIADGLLDGIINNSGVYTSKLTLSRKSVQYQVAIDFNGLFTQLKGKGIVLESLECPSCKGSLQYPETGSIVSCTFCGSTVSAVDVFEKFKGLLDV
jgi:hypothetical protein